MEDGPTQMVLLCFLIPSTSSDLHYYLGKYEAAIGKEEVEKRRAD